MAWFASCMTWKWSKMIIASGRFLETAKANAWGMSMETTSILAFADEDGHAGVEVEHHGQVLVPFPDGDLVDAEPPQTLELGAAEFPRQSCGGTGRPRTFRGCW